jgi:hypothetical protein
LFRRSFVGRNHRKQLIGQVQGAIPLPLRKREP